MPVLRVVDRRVAGRRRVALSWEGPGSAPWTPESEVDVAVDAVESERVRWYLEDYAEFPADPAPLVAAEAEQVLASVGRRLFDGVFGAREAAATWTLASTGSAEGLAGLRVEVDADPTDVPGLPWELLRDPASDRPVVLGAAEFVRTHRQAARPPVVPPAAGERLRVLLVICRPGGGDDVPFRSVASRLVRGGAERMDGLELEVLRPPTVERLAEVLDAAAADGRPYHVVHFDGHGAFLDAADVVDAPLPSLTFGAARSGRHGYLLFEDPATESNQRLVDGPSLAALLVRARVPVLVLNACRSAYAEAPAPTDDAVSDDVHEQLRAYGSLAAEVADAGVPGVVAMRYNVYVVTAAQFVADLYAHLVAGKTLGAAATAARRALAADPTRQVAATAVALQDWVVPTVYEAVPLHLLDRRPAAPPLIRLDATEPAQSDADVPRAPDVGFFGRDETLLALDRAFDTHPVVLLHAYAGAGKTTTAAEFARWYATTGGLGEAGVTLWTSFEQHTPLARVLDAAGTVFAPLLEANGVHWAALTELDERRRVILQVLDLVPVLWVWDNVEPVAGFPAGTRSAWTDDEQRELAAFLRALAGTATKVLLTSRRTEADSSWLGELPVRVALPPMPMRERLQLVHALVTHLAPHPVAGEVDWRPLLRFTGGNPLTIAVTVRQLLRTSPAPTSTEIAAFADRLRQGLAAPEAETDAVEGRDRSLAASLAYGFEQTFTEDEHAVLALLHLFRESVDAGVLALMGADGLPDAVPTLAGVSPDHLTALLDRAAEIGLVTAIGGRTYGIHPALPWFFTTLFRRWYPTPGSRARAERAYCHAYGTIGTDAHARVQDGHATVVMDWLRAAEQNLKHALDRSRARRLPNEAIWCLQGLHALLSLTGRDSEWSRLVGEIEGDYLDPVTYRPRAGTERGQYALVLRYQVDIASARRDWPTAVRLQSAAIAVHRELAAPHLNGPADRLGDRERGQIRELAVSELALGRLQLNQDDADCLSHLHRAHDLAVRSGDTYVQSGCANHLGIAYRSLSALQDLDKARRWHQRELDLLHPDDRIARAAAHMSLANVAFVAFRQGLQAEAPDEELIADLRAAEEGYLDGLRLLPADHHAYSAAAHHQLGLVYSQVRQVAPAMNHLQQAIRHREALGDAYGAGQTRYSIALLLATDRPTDALHYARAAYANYDSVGPGAVEDAETARSLVTDLQRRIADSP